MSHYTIGILGLGTFGHAIIKTLSKYDCHIIAIDNHENEINKIESYLSRGVIGDVTDKNTLRAAGIDTCDAVVVATGTNLESSVLAVLHCKALGVEKVIAKVKSKTSAEVLLKIGADKIISPERETGISVAKLLLHRSTQSLIDISDTISIVEFLPPKKWIGKNLLELNLREKYLLNILGYRDANSQKMSIHITPDYIFNDKESVIAITDKDMIDHFEEYINKM